MAHTPGPWIRYGVRQKLGGEDCLRVGRGGFAIALLPIGRTHNDHAGAMADAALIAAAPTMLAALRSARARLALVFGPDRDPRDDATVREIDAAIEKATGQ